MGEGWRRAGRAGEPEERTREGLGEAWNRTVCDAASIAAAVEDDDDDDDDDDEEEEEEEEEEEVEGDSDKLACGVRGRGVVGLCLLRRWPEPVPGVLAVAVGGEEGEGEREEEEDGEPGVAEEEEEQEEEEEGLKRRLVRAEE